MSSRLSGAGPHFLQWCKFLDFSPNSCQIFLFLLLLSSFPRCDIINNLPFPFPLMAGAWAIIFKLLRSNWLTASPQLCKQSSIANNGYSGENRGDGNPGISNERDRERVGGTKGKKYWNAFRLSKEILAKEIDWAVKQWLMQISKAHINAMDVFCVLDEFPDWNFQILLTV